jgi:hypothetical protein
MRDSQSSKVRWLTSAWFWVAVLLVLPGCDLVFQLKSPPPAESHFKPGSTPRNYAIFCDIESRTAGQERRCATAEEASAGNGVFMPQSRAAVALTRGESGLGNVALDYSEIATSCSGLPQVVRYVGSYPQGLPLCVNFNQTIGPDPLPYPDADKVCVAFCKDHYGSRLSSPIPDVDSFCETGARASTNYPFDGEPGLFGLGGFLAACTAEGALLNEFDVEFGYHDPRRDSEPVDWDPHPMSLIGVTVSGPQSNTLTRTAPSGVAGAASLQVIAGGDGYVEFTAVERNFRRVIGLSPGAPPDTDPSLNDVEFGIDLGSTGFVRVVESGTTRGTFGPYSVDGPQTFRVSVTANNDVGRTAVVRYSSIAGSCNPGAPCAETVFYTSTLQPTYPFLVDTSFTQQGGTVANVRLVRIKR